MAKRKYKHHDDAFDGYVDPTPAGDACDVLTFEAALASFGRRAIVLDGEGECILALQIPAADVAKLVMNYEALLNRTFEVKIKL